MNTVAIVVLLFLVLAIGLAYVQASTGQEVYIYYFDSRVNTLVPERRLIPETNQEETLRSVLRLMYATPRNVNLRQTIPEDLFVYENVIVAGGIMYINFPANYHQMTSYEEALFRASLVRTITGLHFIDSVQVLVEGRELLNPFGNPIGAESRDTVIVGEPIRPRRVFTTTLRLYFVDGDQNGLVYELREIERPDGVPVEQAVLEQLQVGPTTYGLISTIPAGTRILEVRTIGGICSINLSDEFVNNFSGSQDLAELTLQSIVHSVMENSSPSSVHSIQFLIESGRVDNFFGVPYFDTLFERE